MKVYKVVLSIIDFDEVGDEMADYIEDAHYPNDCLSLRVVSIESRDIGEWSDDHPLNQSDTAKAEFERLFLYEGLSRGAPNREKGVLRECPDKSSNWLRYGRSDTEMMTRVNSELFARDAQAEMTYLAVTKGGYTFESFWAEYNAELSGWGNVWFDRANGKIIPNEKVSFDGKIATVKE